MAGNAHALPKVEYVRPYMIFDRTLARKYIVFCSENAVVAGTPLMPPGNKQGRAGPRRDEREGPRRETNMRTERNIGQNG